MIGWSAILPVKYGCVGNILIVIPYLTPLKNHGDALLHHQNGVTSIRLLLENPGSDPH